MQQQLCRIVPAELLLFATERSIYRFSSTIYIPFIWYSGPHSSRRRPICAYRLPRIVFHTIRGNLKPRHAGKASRPDARAHNISPGNPAKHPLLSAALRRKIPCTQLPQWAAATVHRNTAPAQTKTRARTGFKEVHSVNCSTKKCLLGQLYEFCTLLTEEWRFFSLFFPLNLWKSLWEKWKTV